MNVKVELSLTGQLRICKARLDKDMVDSLGLDYVLYKCAFMDQNINCTAKPIRYCCTEKKMYNKNYVKMYYWINIFLE